MRRNNKQLVAVLLAAAMVFTGCAPAASTGDTSGTGATETAAAANADTAEVQTEETEAAEGQSGDETSVLEALAEENPEQEDPNPVVYDDGTPWLDTSLYLGDDSIMPEESSAADDFYYYVNKEFLEDAEKRFNPNGITISELSEANPFDFEGYAALIDDESNTSDAARIMREITSITTSQKANAKGVQEASVFLTDLDQVETLDQLTDFIVSHPYYMFDSEHYVCYQIYGLTLVAYGKDSKDITKTAAGFDNIKLILKDTSEYEERTSIGANEELNAGTLLNAGYAWMLRYDLDPSKDLADTLDIEKRYMEGIDSQDAYAMDYYEKSYNPVTQEELASKYSAYPFAQIAANLTHDVEILIDSNPAFCANLDKLYTEENLDILKESIRVQYVLNTLQLMSFSGYYYANTIRNFDYPRYHVTVTNPSAGEEEAPAAAATGEESAQYATEEPTLGAGTDMELTEEEAAEASTEMPAPQGEEETVFPYHDQLLEVLKENYGSDDMAQAFTADACANIYYEPLTQLVAEKVDSAQMKTDVDEMCRNIIKEYHGIINRQEWLSDETKAKAIEKIDSMTVRTLFPDKYSDLSGLSFEGLSYYGVFQKLIDTSIAASWKKVIKIYTEGEIF
jgi:predicted metalloendopeptidase